MRDAGFILERIPDELKPAAALGIGAAMLVAMVLFHGAGLHHILLQHKRGRLRLLLGRPHLIMASLLFAWSVFLMLALHLLGIMIWAFVLTYLGLIARASDAIYFCANAYTTLGYGVVDLGAQWRNISPIIAISGLFTFAWSTSALVTVVAAHSRLVEQLEEERDRQIVMRKAAWEEARKVRDKNREAELAERQTAREQAAGTSFFERRRIWKAERLREDELRHAARIELETILHKERIAEEKLGQGTPPEDDGNRGPAHTGGGNG